MRDSHPARLSANSPANSPAGTGGRSGGGDTAFISLRNVDKYFGDFQALDDVSLDIGLGQKIVICGPSGSGKSTLIRCINRLETHDRGAISIDGVTLDDGAAARAVLRNNVGMVFQQFNLFPHLSILENLTLGPVRARGSIRKRRASWRILSRAGEDSRADRQISASAFRWPAAACGDCPGAVHGAADHAVRRADLGARSRDDRRGSRGDRGTGGKRYDDDLRDPRDGIRRPCRRPDGVHGQWQDRRDGAAGHLFLETRERALPDLPARSCGTRGRR